MSVFVPSLVSVSAALLEGDATRSSGDSIFLPARSRAHLFELAPIDPQRRTEGTSR